MLTRIVRVLLVTLLITACSDDPARDQAARESSVVSVPPIPAPPDVATPPSDAPRTSSGLASRVLTAGTGTRHPRPNSRVTVHYTGWTTDGMMFDSSVQRGESISFALDEVIPGWTEGVQMMVEGEKRRFWIPEGLAYKGASGAPAGLLVFDVELIRIES